MTEQGHDVELGRASEPGHAGGLGPPAGDVALVDLLDRLLAGGVVIGGDVTIALAGVDLVRLSLRLLVSSVETIERGRGGHGGEDGPGSRP